MWYFEFDNRRRRYSGEDYDINALRCYGSGEGDNPHELIQDILSLVSKPESKLEGKSSDDNCN